MPSNQIELPVMEKIMTANDRIALENRTLLDQNGVVAVNVMASPGAGKTSLIERTLEALGGRFRVAAVDGDVATSIDALAVGLTLAALQVSVIYPAAVIGLITCGMCIVAIAGGRRFGPRP